MPLRATAGDTHFGGEDLAIASFSTSQLGGIPPMPRGVLHINVAFDIDVNGVLYESAKDQTTSNQYKLDVELHLG
eukprot:jgi/Chlat1/1160/Chrsp112S01634